MKLNLKKQNIKNLSLDSNQLPSGITPQIGGGITAAANCPPGTTQESITNCPSEPCSQDLECASFGGTCGCLSESVRQLTCGSH